VRGRLRYNPPVGLRDSLGRRLRRVRTLRRDPASGLLAYPAFGARIFVRSRDDFPYLDDVAWLCEKVIFARYLPRSGDTVVDFGAGFGEEAAWLAQRSPGVRYLGVEIQPSVFECLAHTMAALGPDHRAFPLAVGNGREVRIRSHQAYEKVGADGAGPVAVPAVSWRELASRFGLGRIDLLKVNIEGGERDLLEAIDDFGPIRRVVVSAHDFRAIRGEGEHYRTRAAITARLASQGYRLSGFQLGKRWADDWIFAERDEG
jgi:FkbM family methyltransferase